MLVHGLPSTKGSTVQGRSDENETGKEKLGSTSLKREGESFQHHKARKLITCLFLRSTAIVDLYVKEGNICANFAAVPEAARVPPTALGVPPVGKAKHRDNVFRFWAI